MKNEKPYIAEWIAYHRAVGFDRIHIYDNDSTDNSGEYLNALATAGILDYCMPWRNKRGSPQISAYKHAIKACLTDWLVFLDADEFFNIHSRQSINNLLAQYSDDISSIAFNWRVFGSAGQRKAANGLVIERFTRASLLNASVNRHVKCVFRPQHAGAAHIHATTMRAGKSVMASGEPLEMDIRGYANSVSFLPAQINHYFTKSYEEYLAKRLRGNANRNISHPEKFSRYSDEMFREHDLNDDIDTTICWAAESVRALCEEWAVKAPLCVFP
ncbi:glycosyltransferase family 2 protein [Aphanothece microscopica]